jgi:hypothetical protein
VGCGKENIQLVLPKDIPIKKIVGIDISRFWRVKLL